MLSMQTRLKCEHSYAAEDSPDLFCDFDGKCDGKLYECCLFGKSMAECMEIIAENERAVKLTELEKLKRQKRDIENRIKELTYGQTVRFGDAKLDRIAYPGSNHLPDWRVMVWTYQKDYEGKDRKQPWRSINHIQPIIDSLTGLLEKLKGGD